MIAKRLEREGQILIPQVDSQAPAARYSGSLRSTLKLPDGMVPEGTAAPEVIEPGTEDFRARMKRIINQDTDATGTGS
jgi:hypothetical protein